MDQSVSARSVNCIHTKCMEWHYPQCLQAEQPILAFATQVIQRTAVMIAKWQLVGFAHGVMNTDNLNITGSTLDFGPYGFMERFRPNWINNHSDYQVAILISSNQASATGTCGCG